MSFQLESIKSKCYKPQTVFIFLIVISLTLFLQFNQNDFGTFNPTNLDEYTQFNDGLFKQSDGEKSHQTRRLALIENICDSYRKDPELRKEYVDDPGSQMKGKFTFEKNSRMVFCNIMKQGLYANNCISWNIFHVSTFLGTTTWARIFLQLYLPNAVNWKSNKWQKYSPFKVGYQVKLRQVQNAHLKIKDRKQILKSLEQKEHDYFAFFVCRNPIERLKSLYSYSLHLDRFKPGHKPRNFPDFIKRVFSNQPILGRLYRHLNRTLTLPSPVFNPMFTHCSPCTRHYDAVVNMETFSQDAKHILRERGKEGSVLVSHSNNHGSQTITKAEVVKLFRDMPRTTTETIVKQLRPDFELCGYNQTLNWILEASA